MGICLSKDSLMVLFSPITGVQKFIFFACGAGRGAFIGSAPGRETLTDPPVKCTLETRYKSVKVRLKHG